MVMLATIARLSMENKEAIDELSVKAILHPAVNIELRWKALVAGIGLVGKYSKDWICNLYKAVLVSLRQTNPGK